MYTVIASFFSKRFNTHLGKTVSTDAVYRQTIQKEKEWLEDGIIGVDMETSALLSVCKYYHIPAVSILMVSDIHLLDDSKQWEWEINNLSEVKEKFIDLLIEYLKTIES